MIVVAGHLEVEPDVRAAYLDGCREVVRLARAAPGCLDFALSADLVEPGRVNVLERWERLEDVEAFRGSGPGDDQLSQLRAVRVEQYEVVAAGTP